VTTDCPFNLCDGTGYLVRGDTAYLCKCYAQQDIDRCFRSASIPEEFTGLSIASFDVNLYQLPKSRARAAESKRIAINYVKEFRKVQEMGKGLYFYSAKAGSGKTRLAASVANALVKTHHARVKFITAKDLLGDIMNTYNSEVKTTESELIDAVRHVDVLIMDDIGVEKQTDWVEGILYAVFNSRMTSKKITIFTSNCTIEGLQHHERIRSRINRMVLPVWLPEEEVRKELARAENEQLQKLLLGGQ
jgi:DNA replication protein DnaC